MTAPDPTVDVAELRALLGAATPGPWHEDGPFWVDPPDAPMSEATVETRAGVTGVDRVLVYRGSWETRDADAALIAAAVNALPTLLAAVEERDRLVAELATVKAAIEGLDGFVNTFEGERREGAAAVAMFIKMIAAVRTDDANGEGAR